MVGMNGYNNIRKEIWFPLENMYIYSVFRIRIRSGFIRSVDPYPYQDPESGFGSKRAKIAHKSDKIEFFLEISCFEVLCVLFWGLKVSSVAWKSFYGGLRRGKLPFLIKKNKYFFSAVFGHQNPGSESGFSLKCWIRIKWIRIRNTAYVGTNIRWPDRGT
jgi:hypothetical protein